MMKNQDNISILSDGKRKIVFRIKGPPLSLSVRGSLPAYFSRHVKYITQTLVTPFHRD